MSIAAAAFVDATAPVQGQAHTVCGGVPGAPAGRLGVSAATRAGRLMAAVAVGPLVRLPTELVAVASASSIAIKGQKTYHLARGGCSGGHLGGGSPRRWRMGDARARRSSLLRRHPTPEPKPLRLLVDNGSVSLGTYRRHPRPPPHDRRVGRRPRRPLQQREPQSHERHAWATAGTSCRLPSVAGAARRSATPSSAGALGPHASASRGTTSRRRRHVRPAAVAAAAAAVVAAPRATARSSQTTVGGAAGAPPTPSPPLSAPARHTHRRTPLRGRRGPQPPPRRRCGVVSGGAASVGELGRGGGGGVVAPPTLRRCGGGGAHRGGGGGGRGRHPSWRTRGARVIVAAARGGGIPTLPGGNVARVGREHPARVDMVSTRCQDARVKYWGPSIGRTLHDCVHPTPKVL